MAANFPYVNAPGALNSMISKLRSAFPSAVTIDTLKKLGLGAQNESYIINTLRFLKIIDDNGARVAENTKGFLNDDAKFKSGMEELVQKAYKDLFDNHGQAAWTLERDALTTFFRMSDGTSDIVGGRQANTFQLLAQLAGKAEIPSARAATPAKTNGTRPPAKPRVPAKPAASSIPNSNGTDGAGGGLNFSIRLELNLPASADQKVYDAIFKSLRENLIEPNRTSGL